jgi:hypothetical protein
MNNSAVTAEKNTPDEQIVPEETVAPEITAAIDEDDFELPSVACYYRPGDPEFEGCESCQ